MSMNRNDALEQLAHGISKFDGLTAGELLDSGWQGLRGLCAKDVEYFAEHSHLPIKDVAKACQGRSLARIEE